jgi:hypothetical protein
MTRPSVAQNGGVCPRAVQKIVGEILAQKPRVEQLETADASGVCIPSACVHLRASPTPRHVLSVQRLRYLASTGWKNGRRLGLC